MILVDTSIWADHIDRPDRRLIALLDDDLVLIHPYVIGELALGNLRDRVGTIKSLRRLPSAIVAFGGEVMDYIGRYGLSGTGIGYVDAHLLVSAKLTPEANLWTRDRRLRTQAERLGVAFEPGAS